MFNHKRDKWNDSGIFNINAIYSSRLCFQSVIVIMIKIPDSFHICKKKVQLGEDIWERAEICYGIAIRVDDKADFDGKRTPLACSIGEADNIDRFDAYRIYETLQWVKYNEMTLDEKNAHTDKVLEKLAKLKEEPFSTQTGKYMWIEKLDYQIGFYEKLRRQIKMSYLDL